MLPLAISRETLIESALVVLAVAALAVGYGAVILLRRERRRARSVAGSPGPDEPA